MSMFMGQALRLFSQPSALYEWPSLTFVAINDAGVRLASRFPTRSEADPPMSWIGLTDDEVREHLCADTRQHMVHETEYGEMHFSLIQAMDYHPRPTLMLTSLHPTGGPRGLLDHQRIRTMLMMNEKSEAAVERLESAMQLVASAHQGVQEMLKEFNESVSIVNENLRELGLDKAPEA